MHSSKPNYDVDPRLPRPEGHRVFTGPDVWREIRQAAAGIARPVVVVDCYPGVDEDGIRAALEDHFEQVLGVPDLAALAIEDIDALIADDVGEDRVFGRVTSRVLGDLYDPEALTALQNSVAGREGPVVLVGWGASLVTEGDVLVLADLPRWEIQQRMRAGMPNWRSHNSDEDILRKYKRGFFVEWRMADAHKRRFFDVVDFFLDTTTGVDDARLISGDAFRAALSDASRRPFRLVPYFDPGVWGGNWMQQRLGIAGDVPNYAWAFDCVPEENSLAWDFDGTRVEMPAQNLVLQHPVELLGPGTFAHFGADFPIRFDFLDTMGGGNLSLQVHPTNQYIREQFGMRYTQDESYYVLDTSDDSAVYLGLKPDVDPAGMFDALARANRGEEDFDAERFVNRFPARKHDHVLIPAGTVHCSSRNTMVLEISATSFIFTFKMWDWGRVGLDGKPRPTHLEHARNNIAWERDTDWVLEHLVNRVELLEEGPGYRVERTGLHELEFIETVRHWFSVPTLRDTHSTVNVLNLVEGRAAVVESPDGSFEPFEVHYAETFVVPAAVGRYSIRPADGVAECATMTAFVRGTEAPRSIAEPARCSKRSIG